jgi:phytoene synthase
VSGTAELDAAGIRDPDLRASYHAARRLAARHGRTYFLATRLLPPAIRPSVHALYAVARAADDIVDQPGGCDGATVAAGLDRLAAAVGGHGALAPGWPGHDLLPAVHHTADRHDVDPALFTAFFASMRRDLDQASYADFEALRGYTYGSAEVIGLQMLAVIGCLPGTRECAARHARDLGTAFQLTNFIRDVGEDLDRGRVYLPLADLERFGVSVEDLQRRVVDGRVRLLLAFEVARAREFYRAALPGIGLLDPAGRDCIAVATTLYGEILDAVEAADYRVLDRRVAVPLPRRLAVFGPAAVRARRSRRSHQTHQATVCTTSEKPKATSSTGA